MRTLIFLLLATSLAANVWLLRGKRSSEPAASKSPAARVAAATPLPDADLIPALLHKLDTTDLAALRDRLRATGMDESSIRGILEGALLRRWSAAAHAEQRPASWWQGGTAGGPSGPSLRAAVREPLRELMGRDPMDVRDAEAPYEFLPEEKRRLLAAIDLDYTELRARAPRAARTVAATRGELDEATLLNAERRKDVLAALTPEERAEYDLRFSGTAAQNSRRLAAMEVTEPEYRAIKPLIDDYRAAIQAVPRNDPSAMVAARNEATQRTLDQLVAAIGYDRAVEYTWTDDGGPQRSTAAVLRDLGLPTGNAAQMLQLAAETGARAATIHQDPSLSVEQKKAALLDLQNVTRPKLDALVPPSAQGKLTPEAIGWFGALGQGNYVPRTPVVQGAGYAGGQPISVASPAKAQPPISAFPRRPGK